MREPIIRLVRTYLPRRTTRVSLILLMTALLVSGAAVAAPLGFLRVEVERDSVVFSLSSSFAARAWRSRATTQIDSDMRSSRVDSSP